MDLREIELEGVD